MVESKGQIKLPEHLVQGLQLNRDTCKVTIRDKTDEGKDVSLICFDQRTIHGCRANYKHNDRDVIGCPLRNTDYHIWQTPVESLDRLDIILIQNSSQ